VPRDKFEVFHEGLAQFESTGEAPESVADGLVLDLSAFDGWMEEPEYHGREGFNDQMARWRAPFETWSMHVTEVLDAGGDDVLVIGTQRGVLAGSPTPVEMPLAQIFTVRDGAVHRIRMFAKAEHAYAAAGVEPPDQASA
jgi:ketosteroid isomerase-like protein